MMVVGIKFGIPDILKCAVPAALYLHIPTLAWNDAEQALAALSLTDFRRAISPSL